MAALLVAALEAGIQLASLGLTISAEVLEAKIKAFYKEYQSQCKVLADLYHLVERLELNKDVLNQLRQNQSFVQQNWSILISRLEKSVNDIKQGNKKFNDVRAMASQQTLWYQKMLKVTMIGLMTMGTGMALQNLHATWKKAPTWGQMRQRMRLIYQRGLSGVATASNQGGILKNYLETHSKGEKFMHCVRVIAFIAGVVSVVMGAMSVHKLKNDLEATKDRFSKENFEKDIIGFMGDLQGLATNVKDLAHASKATINELHKYYLIHCLAYTRDANRANDLLAKFVPADYGLDDAKLERVEEWEAEVKKAKSIEPKKNYNDPNLADHYVERLERYLELYRDLLEKEKIDKLFAELTERLSSMVSKESMVINEVYKDCQLYHRVGEKIKNAILKKRVPNFKDLQVDKKKSIDKSIIRKAQRTYLSEIKDCSFDSDEEDEFKNAVTAMSTSDKSYIAGYIMKWVDQFYGTDMTGKSIYGIEFESVKSQKTMKQIEEMDFCLFHEERKSLSEMIPLYWDDKEKQAKEVWKLLRKAQKWVEKNEIKELKPVLDLKVPETNEMECLEGLPKFYQRYLSINFKKGTQKDENNADVETLDTDGKTILRFEIDKATFTYSTSTLNTDEKVQLLFKPESS